MDFFKKAKCKKQRKKQERKYILKSLYAIFEGRERLLGAFESKIFPIKIEGTDFFDKVLDHYSL